MSKTRKTNKAELDFEDVVYEVTSSADPIRYYGKLHKSEYNTGYNGPGYYFWNKTWDEVIGPFKSLSLCQKALETDRNEVAD